MAQRGESGDMDGDSKFMRGRAARKNAAAKPRKKRERRVEITFSQSEQARIVARAKKERLSVPEFIRAVCRDKINESNGQALRDAVADASKEELRRVIDYALWVLNRLDAQATILPEGASLSDHVAAVAASFERQKICDKLERLTRHVAEIVELRRPPKLPDHTADPNSTGFELLQ